MNGIFSQIWEFITSNGRVLSDDNGGYDIDSAEAEMTFEAEERGEDGEEAASWVRKLLG